MGMGNGLEWWAEVEIVGDRLELDKTRPADAKLLAKIELDELLSLHEVNAKLYASGLHSSFAFPVAFVFPTDCKARL